MKSKDKKEKPKKIKLNKQTIKSLNRSAAADRFFNPGLPPGFSVELVTCGSSVCVIHSTRNWREDP